MQVLEHAQPLHRAQQRAARRWTWTSPVHRRPAAAAARRASTAMPPPYPQGTHAAESYTPEPACHRLWTCAPSASDIRTARCLQAAVFALWNVIRIRSYGRTAHPTDQHGHVTKAQPPHLPQGQRGQQRERGRDGRRAHQRVVRGRRRGAGALAAVAAAAQSRHRCSIAASKCYSSDHPEQPDVFCAVESLLLRLSVIAVDLIASHDTMNILAQTQPLPKGAAHGASANADHVLQRCQLISSFSARCNIIGGSVGLLSSCKLRTTVSDTAASEIASPLHTQVFAPQSQRPRVAPSAASPCSAGRAAGTATTAATPISRRSFKGHVACGLLLVAHSL